VKSIGEYGISESGIVQHDAMISIAMGNFTSKVRIILWIEDIGLKNCCRARQTKNLTYPDRISDSISDSLSVAPS
jgi:hypothetical protein